MFAALVDHGGCNGGGDGDNTMKNELLSSREKIVEGGAEGVEKTTDDETCLDVCSFLDGWCTIVLRIISIISTK